MTIRRARTADDARTVSDLLFEAFRDYRHLYTARAFAATTITESEVLHRLQEGPIWIARLEHEPVGTVSAICRTQDVYVRSMAVAATARRRGVGRALLAEIEQFAIASGCRSLVLSTTPFLTDAIRLYERYGFVRGGGGPSDLFGTPLLTMVRKLPGKPLITFRHSQKRSNRRST